MDFNSLLIQEQMEASIVFADLTSHYSSEVPLADCFYQCWHGYKSSKMQNILIQFTFFPQLPFNSPDTGHMANLFTFQISVLWHFFILAITFNIIYLIEK